MGKNLDVSLPLNKPDLGFKAGINLEFKKKEFGLDDKKTKIHASIVKRF